MPSMPRPPKAEEIFEGVMGEPHNASRSIKIKRPKNSQSRIKKNNGDVYNSNAEPIFGNKQNEE